MVLVVMGLLVSDPNSVRVLCVTLFNARTLVCCEQQADCKHKNACLFAVEFVSFYASRGRRTCNNKEELGSCNSVFDVSYVAVQHGASVLHNK